MGIFNFLKKKRADGESLGKGVESGEKGNDSKDKDNQDKDPFSSLGEGLPPLPPMPDINSDQHSSPAGPEGIDSFGDLPPIRAPPGGAAEPAAPPAMAQDQNRNAQNPFQNLQSDENYNENNESIAGKPAASFPDAQNNAQLAQKGAGGAPEEAPPPAFPSDEELIESGSERGKETGEDAYGKVPDSEISEGADRQTENPDIRKANVQGTQESANAINAQAPGQHPYQEMGRGSESVSGFRLFPDKPIRPEVRDFGNVGSPEQHPEMPEKMFPDTFASKTDDVGDFMAGRTPTEAGASVTAPAGGSVSRENFEMPEMPKPSIPTLAIKDESLRRRPLFIRADLYSGALKDVDDAKRFLRDAEEALIRARDVREQIDKQYQKWHDSLEDIQRRLVLVDQKLFE